MDTVLSAIQIIDNRITRLTEEKKNLAEKIRNEKNSPVDLIVYHRTCGGLEQLKSVRRQLKRESIIEENEQLYPKDVHRIFEEEV